MRRDRPGRMRPGPGGACAAGGGRACAPPNTGWPRGARTEPDLERARAAGRYLSSSGAEPPPAGPGIVSSVADPAATGIA